ncbi:MAG: hypothetical protein ACI8VC_000833 [Candidatus Endobugula sp.]|jgi:hypothetical protein
MLFKRRSVDGFNLAFLDVMACGLGAIVLIFMLVKFNAATDTPNDEVERLQEELAALNSNLTDTDQAIAETASTISAEATSLAQIKQRIQNLAQQQDAAQRTVNDKKAILADVEKSVAAAAPLQTNDNVSVQGVGEENYLLGLKVEGKYIGILMDTSASMTDAKLIDIIRRKIGSDAQKKSGPKWRRTQRVVKWLLARVPKASYVSVVSFNDTASKVGTLSRVTASNASSMQQLSKNVGQLIPQNGTNLQAALSEIKKVSPNMTHLYVVTDGLPTLGERSKSLSSLASCTSLFGKSKTITGECRLRLFVYSLQQVKLDGVQVNIILLPLEGDPQAPQAYWNWASATGGLMLSPADSWP